MPPVGFGSMPPASNVAGERTVSTNARMNANPSNNLDGAFLLSHNDVNNTSFFPNAAARVTSREGRENATSWWTRSVGHQRGSFPGAAGNALIVNDSGDATSVNTGIGNRNMGVRPAMILRFSGTSEIQQLVRNTPVGSTFTIVG